MPVNVVKVGPDGRLPEATARGCVSETGSRSRTSATFGMGSNRWQGALLTVQADGTYASARITTMDNSSQTMTNVRISLYSIDGTVATKIAETADLSAAVKANIYAEGAFATPVALKAGQVLYAVVYTDAVMSIPYVNTNNDAWKTIVPPMCVYGTSASGAPATFDAASVGLSSGIPVIQIIPAA